MKITNRELQLIFEAAKQNLLDNSKRPEIDFQQFVAECYTRAVADKLGINAEFEQRVLIEPVEE